jgi:hypothetical protein
MISWVILAPAVAGVLGVRDLARAWHRWRRDEASLNEVLEEIGVAGLVTGIAAATMTHPVIAAGFILLRGGGEIADTMRRRRLTSGARREAPPLEPPAG